MKYPTKIDLITIFVRSFWNLECALEF